MPKPLGLPSSSADPSATARRCRIRRNLPRSPGRPRPHRQRPRGPADRVDLRPDHPAAAGHAAGLLETDHVGRRGRAGDARPGGVPGYGQGPDRPHRRHLRPRARGRHRRRRRCRHHPHPCDRAAGLDGRPIAEADLPSSRSKARWSRCWAASAGTRRCSDRRGGADDRPASALRRAAGARTCWTSAAPAGPLPRADPAGEQRQLRRPGRAAGRHAPRDAPPSSICRSGSRSGSASSLDGRLFRGLQRRGRRGRTPALPWSATETPRLEGLEEYLGSASLVERCARDWPSEEGTPPSNAEELFARAATSAHARACIDRHAADIGRLVAACVGVLDPGLAVLGGGVGQNELMVEQIGRTVAELTWPTEIAVSRLTRKATVLGAVGLAADYSLGTLLGEDRSPAFSTLPAADGEPRPARRLDAGGRRAALIRVRRPAAAAWCRSADNGSCRPAGRRLRPDRRSAAAPGWPAGSRPAARSRAPGSPPGCSRRPGLAAR